MIQFPIYMDSHSTTPMDPRVLEVMTAVYRRTYGNASSRSHLFGREAEALVERSRETIAGFIGARPEEIIFTSGATESNNLAIKGAAYRYRERGNHLISCVTEHPSVLEVCRNLETEGFEVSYLPVDRSGNIDLGALEDMIRPNTILVSLMAANNEIGVIHPLAQIGRMLKEKGVLFHCDASQAVGKIPLEVDVMGMDLASFSAHKMYGPQGIGALFVRASHPRVSLTPITSGGGHERGLRPGTLNVAGIVGFAKACELARAEMIEEGKRLLALREKLRHGILEVLDEVYVNGSLENRLPHNLNLSFAYIEADSLLMSLQEAVALSSGASCASASLEPSHVLKALGIGSALAHGAVRFGLHRFNTEEEVEHVMRRVISEVSQLRRCSPLYELVRETS